MEITQSWKLYKKQHLFYRLDLRKASKENEFFFFFVDGYGIQADSTIMFD